MTKYAYIIPGFMENVDTRKAYRQIASSFKKKGYTPVIVKITWKQRVMSDWLKEFNSQLNGNVNKSIFLGFSFGAMIAFISATQQNPKSLLLCSLSPYFKEDLNKIPKKWHRGIKRRIEDFKNYEFNRLYDKIKCNTTILVGEAEITKYKQLAKRDHIAYEKIDGSKLIIPKDAPHDIGHKNYFSEIKKVIEGL